MSNKYHIIGAGISGLTLALELAKKRQDVRVYEKLNVVGGLTRTEIVNDVSFDCGPHLFHTNNREIKEYWLNLMGSKMISPKLYGANFKDGNIYEYPVSVQSLKSQYSKEDQKKILSELKNISKSKKLTSKNYSEFVRNLAGETLTNIFFTKYPKKLWGISPEKLSARFAPRRVEIRKTQRPFHSGKGKWAGVLADGCGTLSKSLENELNKYGIYVEYNLDFQKFNFSKNNSNNKYKSVSKITFKNKVVKIDQSDTIISTIPITKLAKKVGIKHSLWNRSLKIVCLLIDGSFELFNNYDWLYFDSENLIFHRVTNQNSFTDPNKNQKQTILSCEVAYNENDKIDKKSNKTIIQKCIEDLKSINILGNQKILKKHLIDAKSVYPGIHVGYEEELSRVKGHINLIDNLYSHGALAEYEYADTQVLTAKSIDLAKELTMKNKLDVKSLRKNKKNSPSKSIKINNKKIGDNEECYFIAEIGLNHNGDLDLCKKLIDQAKECGANAVKLQSYLPGRISKKVRTARYYEDLVDTQDSLPSIVDNVQLSFKETKKVFHYAKKRNITIFSTPFDIESLKQLETLNCPAYKISSMDLVNIPLIREVAKTKKPIILSTGMSELADISNAVETIMASGNTDIALLHCVSSYPCSPNNVNLPKIKKLKETFNTIVGFSDHSSGIDITLSSIAIGAKIIEKHFTLDRKMDGPDHNFSLVKEDLKKLINGIRRIEHALYDHGFGVQLCEVDTAQNLRRSIFIDKDLKKGKKITPMDIIIKSPGIGVHPKYYDFVIGKKLLRTRQKDEPLLWEDIS